MKLMYRLAAIAAFAVAALAQPFAQQDDADSVKKMMGELQDMAAAKMRAGAMEAMGGIMTVVKNSPYMADQITERTQTLADGTRIHTEDKVAIARDSQGRVRRETPDRITIWDPVENVTYMLDPKTMSMAQTRVISKAAAEGRKAAIAADRPLVFGAVEGGGTFPLGGEPEFHQVIIAGSTGGNQTVQYKTNQDLAEAKMRARAAAAGTTTPPVNKESLGVKSMEGVSAEGTRETQTIEAGAIGNDRPIQIVNERWYSPDLQTEMMTRHTDPRSGEQVVRLTNVRLSEPDATLFQVPAGYQRPVGPTMRRDQ